MKPEKKEKSIPQHLMETQGYRIDPGQIFFYQHYRHGAASRSENNGCYSPADHPVETGSEQLVKKNHRDTGRARINPRNLFQ